MPISDFTNCNASHCPHSILFNETFEFKQGFLEKEFNAVQKECLKSFQALCVFGTHKSGHLCMCGVEVGICIVCHCVFVEVGLGHAKMGFCVFGTHKSGHLCIRGVGVGISISCHCVCVVLGLGHAKVGFCVFGTHKSGHLCMCGVGVVICIVCHCVFVEVGLGHALITHDTV